MTKMSSSDERRPFLAAPNPKRYFAAAASEEARQRIVRSIARNEGPALLVGAAGVGKSMLLAVLAEQFRPRMSVVTLPGSQLCTRRALLQVILFELGLPYREMDEGELRLSMVAYLRGIATTRTAAADGPAKPRRLLLLVDEAEALPVRLLEELRALTNITVGGVPLVSLVLAGSPILEERFADPHLDAFSQRIAARCYLATLGREETFQYVRSQVAAAGLKPERLFAADALEAMYSATAGVPRLVNQLGDQLVWMAEETGCTPLDAGLVQQAWSELQQLPAPWNTEGHAVHATSGSATTTAATAEMVEFGELDGAFADDMNHRGPRASLPLADDAEDELPASIPIGRALDGRDGKDLGDFRSAIEVTEHLVDSLEDFDALDVLPAEPEPAPPSLAVNPFAEAFGDEEVLVDRYAEFESHMLRRAPQVRNRMDPDMAAQLLGAEYKPRPKSTENRRGLVQFAESAEQIVPDPLPESGSRMGAKASSKPVERAAVITPAVAPTPPADSRPPASRATIETPRVILAPVALPLASGGELLLVEDDGLASPIIVPGRQFRRLFSRLEASALRAQ